MKPKNFFLTPLPPTPSSYFNEITEALKTMMLSRVFLILGSLPWRGRRSIVLLAAVDRTVVLNYRKAGRYRLNLRKKIPQCQSGWIVEQTGQGYWQSLAGWEGTEGGWNWRCCIGIHYWWFGIKPAYIQECGIDEFGEVPFSPAWFCKRETPPNSGRLVKNYELETLISTMTLRLILYKYKISHLAGSSRFCSTIPSIQQPTKG